MKYSFKITKLAEDVYEIENFLNESELKDILKIIKSAKEEDWLDKAYIKNESDFWYGKSLFFDRDNTLLRKAILDKIDYIFSSYFWCEKEVKISRFKQQHFIGQHRDNDTTPEGYYLGYGIVIYFNDNYLGGELEYPELGITIKPKAGSALIHGGEVLHGSLPVIGNDPRYFSTIFMRGNEEYPITLNKDLPF